jgi:hypothetical protein
MSGEHTSAAQVAPPDKAAWYADGLRWIAALFDSAADRLDRAATVHASLDPMPRHTSFDEIVCDMRNRIHTGFGAGNRPYY